jgi:uncharacterized protein YbcV (DUF1398 family)
MDLKTIEQLGEQAKNEKWSYPQLFDALKQAGVVSYETNVPEFEIVYKTDADEIYTPIPNDWISLSVAPELDEAGVKEAIAQAGRHEISYPEFLAEIASSGVSSYSVDMENRTITYKGDDGKALVETVPPAANVSK